MEPQEAKKFIEANLEYDGVKKLLVRLVRTPSPQTELLEAEPRVLSLINDVIRPELERAGVRAASRAPLPHHERERRQHEALA